jgi:hypothetical protein
MIGRYEQSRLKKLPAYSAANDLQNMILMHHMPDNKLLRQLYAESEVRQVKAILENFYANRSVQKVRAYNDNAQSNLYKAMKKLALPKYSVMCTKLLLSEIPDKEELKQLFGEFAENVEIILELYMAYKLKRKCLTNRICHPYRTACLANILGYDQSGDGMYASIMMEHDAIEDLLFVMGESSDHKGLKSLEIYINRYIPEQIKEPVSLLTNYYSIILGYLEFLYSISDEKITKEGLLRGLSFIKGKSSLLRNHVEKLAQLISENEIGEPILSKAKSLAYKNLYIPELAALAVQKDNYRLLESKMLDLADNAAGLQSVSDVDRINGILKLNLWSQQAYNLHSQFGPLNNYVMEIFNEALLLSQVLIVRDLLSPVYKTSYLVSALEKIKLLKEVLYV